MMPMPSRVCTRCGATASSTVQYCTTCGTFLGEPDTTVASGNWALLRTTTGQPVPLLGVALGGEVFGAHARIVLRQRYKNREDRPIEAIYTFPIPADATLTGFAMECEGRRMEAEVKEREEAFQVYDEALSKGHGAALLEQERPNLFTASVGNLLPDEETIIEVSFLQKLTADEGALRLMIPTLVAPKYIPGSPSGDRTGHGTATPTHVVPDADRISPKIADVRYGLAMDVLFDLGRDVTIESPSHAIDTTDEGGQRKRVTFVSPTVALDRDIVLVAEGAPGVTAGVVCDKPADEEGTFALTIVPDLFEAKKRSKGRAVVFVVDVSGSMAGASIDQAKRAMRLCLRHLAEGDLFDILPFSSGYSHFSAQISGARRVSTADMIPFTQTTLKEADHFVDSLRANGGTEMLAPLSAAAQLLDGMRRDRVIVLLTDGQVGNDQQIIDEISKRAAGARVYTFGIGTNVSDHLLRELAKRTKGAVEFIHPTERIDEKVTAQFARATAARVDALSVKWIGVDAGEVAPGDPPPLVDGEPWSVYGRYETPGTGRVEIRGTLGGEPFFAEIPLDLASRADRPALTSLWAGARVKDLENVDTATLGRRAETRKKRIVDLCVRHKIASKHASFVVVEKRSGDRRSQGMPETRAVPVNAPAGWQMSGGAPVDGGALRDRKLQIRSLGGGGAHPPPMPRRSPAPAAAAAAPMSRSASAGPRGISAPTGAPQPPLAQGYAAPPPAPGGYAAPPPAFAPPPPPPPSEMAYPAAAAAPLPVASGRAQSESEGGGFFDRAKKALGLSKAKAPPPMMDAMEMDDSAAELHASRSMDRLVAPEQTGKKEARSESRTNIATGAGAREEIGAMFARQLASGLWEGASGSEEDRLTATTDCLVRCTKEGVDTSNPIYGAQITKAVEALSALAETLLTRAADEKIVRALLAMVAVSTGKRARGRIAAIAQAAGSAVVKAVVPDLASQDAARAKLG